MKTIKLNFGKAYNQATYEQVKKLRSFDTFACNESNSQIMKRLESDEADEIISDLEKGDSINLI